MVAAFALNSQTIKKTVLILVGLVVIAKINLSY